ncbi:MAG: hypothetical protein Q8N30_09670, partial [Methylococcales bacterium]|nr:hypothetical protein [Methylococcales bacterium]
EYMAAILISVNDIIMKLILAIIEESIYVPTIKGASFAWIFSNDALRASARPMINEPYRVRL